MKRILIPALIVLCSLTASAQPFRRTDSLSLAFDRALQSVFFDYAYDFNNIQGELVADEAEYEKFASTVSLPGSQECIITRFHSILDTTSSWQATMLVTDDYGDAKRLYKTLCQQVKSTRIMLADGSIVFFESNYEAPDAGKKFITSYYQLPGDDPRFQNVSVEVELLTLLMDYKVVVNIHSKPPDTLGY